MFDNEGLRRFKMTTNLIFFITAAQISVDFIFLIFFTCKNCETAQRSWKPWTVLALYAISFPRFKSYHSSCIPWKTPSSAPNPSTAILHSAASGSKLEQFANGGKSSFFSSNVPASRVQHFHRFCNLFIFKLPREYTKTFEFKFFMPNGNSFHSTAMLECLLLWHNPSRRFSRASFLSQNILFSHSRRN